MAFVTAAAAIFGNELVADPWIEILDDRIESLGTGRPPVGAATDLAGCTIVPGFVDQHCHGGNRGDFFAGRTDAASIGAQMHLEHGTTTLVASLVTAAPADLLGQVRALVPLVDDGTLAGIHLEGPWLSTRRCGAHDPDLLRAPDPVEIRALLEAGGGRIVMVTIAPELDGALSAIAQLRQAGVIVAVGHTDCSHEQALQAVDAGATVATHLFNQMPAMHKRAPGPVLALLDDARVTVELIPDGVHVDPALVGFVARALGSGRVAAVTDAMGAAGAPDGQYEIGALHVEVVDSVARLAGGGPLAGSTLTMDRALRTLVHACGLPLVAASATTSTTPARVLGLSDRGRIAPGLRADLVAVDTELHVVAVMRAGTWVAVP